MRHEALIPIMAIALLAGCGKRSEDIPPSDAAASEEGEGQEAEPVSIIRDDVRAEVGADAIEDAAPTRLVVGFPQGGTELDEAAMTALDDFASADWVGGLERVYLWGHSDTVGSDAANFRAGQARAEAVADYLVTKGIARERMTIVSLGEGNPAQPNYLPDGSNNAEGQAANRRVEIRVGEEQEAQGGAAEDAVAE